MLNNFFKIFFRNAWNHAGYTLSSLSSLSIGIATCTIILLFVRYEYNWNTYNKNYNYTYRVQQKVIFKDKTQIDTQTGYALAAELKKQIPEIENSTVTSYRFDDYLSTSDKLTFNEKDGCYADNNIFKILTFEFIQGNPENALSAPYSVVLTQEIANKYFPDENAFGRIIKSANNKLLKVTGVIKDLPFNLDYRPSYLVSMPTYREVAGWKGFEKLENIGASIFFTFVTLKPNVSVKAINDKIYNFQDQYVTNNYKKLYLKPFSELHLTASERNDTLIALYYVEAFALFVLILACVNFINLSTANSFLRKKEIGVRKVVGASRFSLFFQFIGDSLSFTFAAMIISSILVYFLLPLFNTIAFTQIDINFAKDYKFFLLMFLVFMVTGFLAGIYPALYLSGFKPVHIIKGNLSMLKQNRKGSSKGFLRKSLVTFQFCISVILLIGTIYVIRQVDFMQKKDLGFVKDNLLIGYVYGSDISGRFESLRNELLNNPNVLNISVSDNAPFHGNFGKEINWEGASINDKMGINFNEVSYDFINTYRMKVILGRNFSKDFSSDSNACIINETAMKSLNWSDPLGKKIDNNKYSIIGVVKDFHPYSVHEKILPFYMVLKRDKVINGNIFSIRIKEDNNDKTINFVRWQFRNFFPSAIIEVTTFDNKFNAGTKGTWQVVKNLFTGFAIIAIFIAANGLFGMISFASQRRLKEIGIRKVFGANSPQIYLLMSKEFVFILLCSTLFMLPSGYLFIHTTPGAYKYDMQFIDYFLAVMIMVLTAISATVYHTTKAILSNPVDTLRYE